VRGVVVVALVLVLVGCASAPAPRCDAYYAPPIRKPLVWRVTGPQGSLVLLATHQAAAPGDVPRVAWSELERADVFVAEADEMPSIHGVRGRDEWTDAFYLPRGTSLQKLLGDDDYAELRSHIDGPVNHYKPWVAMLKLAASASRYPSPSLNVAVLDRVRQLGKPAEFLETWEEQVRYLDDAVTPATLAGMIHDYPRLGCVMTNRLAAFRAGDEAVFVNEIANANEPVVPRIGRWFVRLDEYITAGRHAFVAIGVGQIVGPYGLLVRFAERGYVVQRL
jgi:uncharacterized protein YbaP (TraB family)